MDLPNTHLIITHNANDEGEDYWLWLEHEAKKMSVNLFRVDHIISENSSNHRNKSVFSLWDAYPSADVITYPSIYEGFGNALLEAIYFRRIVIINRYPVYNADIRPKGFEFLELEGYVDELIVQRTKQLLKEPELVNEITEKNYNIANEFFSYEVLEQKLQELLNNF